MKCKELRSWEELSHFLILYVFVLTTFEKYGKE